MSRRKKKGEPELLIVSFCDIVTITIAALFFALLFTVQEAVKIPIFRPLPRSIPSNKRPVFIECRGNQLYYIDKDQLDSKVAKLLSTVSPSVRGGDIGQFLKVIQAEEVGNEYYKVNSSYLLTAVMALDPRPGVAGEPISDLEQPNSKLQTMLSGLETENQYIAFLVRDDSFAVFRKARLVAAQHDFDTGWELLGAEEPVKFGTSGTPITVQ